MQMSAKGGIEPGQLQNQLPVLLLSYAHLIKSVLLNKMVV
jgi:hypothetical protein